MLFMLFSLALVFVLSFSHKRRLNERLEVSEAKLVHTLEVLEECQKRWNIEPECPCTYYKREVE